MCIWAGRRGTLIYYQLVVTWLLSFNPFSALTRTDQDAFRESRDKKKRCKTDSVMVQCILGGGEEEVCYSFFFFKGIPLFLLFIYF